ncbi:MAG: hypothetical protein GOV01_03915 [Candidatus Altiarchaeota archaeon]|nr:hypothetical protein [Candidatus Altiarchaeota archaeon]
MMISDKLCVSCKGKLWCGLSSCPLYDSIKKFKETVLTREVSAPSPPNYMVSWKGYPNVSVGPNLSLKEISKNPYDLKLEDFVRIRANELRTYQNKGIRTTEETALSVKTVDFDVQLKTIPKVLGPNGLIAQAKNITPGDVKVPGKVYSIVDSYDLKAQDAMLKLGDYGFDYLVQVLSTGNLGIKSQRKLVPTRWAITAVDSVLAKNHFKDIRSAPQIKEFELYSTSHWDNHFLIILAPWGWGFEMLERWHDGDIIQDWEYGRLKAKYASNITGAYYSARLEVLKQLSERKKLASAIVIRQIGKEYVYPVGVWHVRESVERALDKRPEKFSSLADLKLRLETNKDWTEWKQRSEIWKIISKQRRLEDFT